jgi:hypothetical protein
MLGMVGATTGEVKGEVTGGAIGVLGAATGASGMTGALIGDAKGAVIGVGAMGATTGDILGAVGPVMGAGTGAIIGEPCGVGILEDLLSLYKNRSKVGKLNAVYAGRTSK